MGLNAGGVDYVTKPINTTELLARMDVHLANARMTRSARSALDIQHSVEYLALVDGREYLLRLKTPQNQSSAAAALRERFQLTLRESDVLLWIANGKTNREIAQILGMSPRPVNKHLEQVFRKLGVENRTSAAASAIRLLATQ